MTLSDIIREIGELGCRNTNIQSDIKGWVNREQRAIAQMRNWTFLHSQLSATILAGTSSIALSARFKELAPERTPITYTAPGAQSATPVTIKSRAELESTFPNGTGMVVNANGFWSPYFVFLEQNDGGQWTLNTPAGYVHASNATYSLSCYLYPTDLSLGTDHNGITDDAELAEALINRVRAKAYAAEDPTDPRAEAAAAIADRHISAACVQDARKRIAGRRLHW